MKWKWPEAARRWKGALGSYSYVLLVIAVGAALLLLPTGGRDSPGEDTPTQAEGASFDLDAFEAKLERVLSQVEGAGDTRVVLTLDGGSRQVLARNQDREQRRRQLQHGGHRGKGLRRSGGGPPPDGGPAVPGGACRLPRRRGRRHPAEAH